MACTWGLMPRMCFARDVLRYVMGFGVLWVVKVERFQWNERPSCAHATSKVDQCCVQLVSSKLVFFSFLTFSWVLHCQRLCVTSYLGCVYTMFSCDHLQSTCGESLASQYVMSVFCCISYHFEDVLGVVSTRCFLIFHTAKLAKTEFVVHRRPIGVDLAFGQLIWLPDPTASQWDLTQFC